MQKLGKGSQMIKTFLGLPRPSLFQIFIVLFTIPPRIGSSQEWAVFKNGQYSRMGSIHEWAVFKNGQYSRMGSIQEGAVFKNGQYSRMGTIHSRMVSIQEWAVFKNIQFGKKLLYYSLMYAENS